MRVLMVDDHVMFLQGLKSLLGVLAPELRIDTADTAASALRLAVEAPYELVLLDWNLVDCDGAQMIERLREAGCTARVVVLSGETRTALIRQSVDAGAAGFVPKTFSPELMLAALEVVVQGGIYLPPEMLMGQPTAARLFRRRGTGRGR